MLGCLVEGLILLSGSYMCVRRNCFVLLLSASLMSIQVAHAMETRRPYTWASPGPDQSLRIYRDAVKFAFSPDGKILARVGERSVVLQDVATRSERALAFDGGTSLVGIAFSPDGGVLAGITDGGRLLVWNTQTLVGKALPVSGAVGAVAFSPDGRVLASGDQTGQVTLWSVVKNTAGGVIPASGADGQARSLRPTSHMLAAASSDGLLSVWDLKAGPATPALQGAANGTVTGMVF